MAAHAPVKQDHRRHAAAPVTHPGDPPDRELMLAEYRALREEIGHAQARGWQALGAGVAVVPAAQHLAQTYEITVLMLALPLLMMVVGLMYVSQNLSVALIAEYFREHLEPRSGGGLHWERWLEGDDEERPNPIRYVESMLWFGFFLLFFLYYASSSYLAVSRAQEVLGVQASAGLLAGYVSIGLWMGIYFIRQGAMRRAARRRD